MTPTPRTDAIAYRGYIESAYIAEMTDLAREMERELAAWEDELSKAMPPDFKDWWQNSKAEWPLVARRVIEGKSSHVSGMHVVQARMEQMIAAERERLDFSERARRSLSAAADYLNARLRSERALADRLARELEWVGSEAGGYANQLAIEALAAWKEARRDP